MDYLEVVGSVATALIPLLFKKVRSHLWRPFSYLYKSLTLPHYNHAELQSMRDVLDRVDSKTDTLVHQVTTNGGQSLMDTINVLLLQSFIESQSRRKLMSAYGYAFWESDRNGQCTYASQALAEIAGLSQDEILGEGWVTNLKPTDRAPIKEAWDSAVKERRRFTANYSFIHEDGTEVTVQGMSFPIIHNGNVEGFVGILTPLNNL